MAETKDTGTVSGSAADENGEDEYRKFFAERKKIKRKGYVAFASVGWYLFFIGSAIAGLSFAIMVALQTRYTISGLIVGVVLNTAGVILASLVPVDEIDLETELSRENQRCRRTVVVGGVGITLTVVMIVLISVPPYFVQAIMILQGVLIMDDNNYHSVFFERIGVPEYLHPPKEFTLKVAQYVILLPMCFGLSTLVIGIDPRFYLDHCLLEGTCNSGFVTDAVTRHFNIWQIALIIVGIGTTLMTLIAMYMYWFRMREIHDAEGANKRPKGIETACLFDSIYLAIIALAITNVGYGVASAIAQFLYDAKVWPLMQWFLVGFGIFQVLSIMLVLLIGKEECFSVLDRTMETDVERLMHDGSWLSELVSSSENFEKGDNYWVYREKEFSDVLSEDGHHIKREFFIRAKIKKVTRRVEDAKQIEILRVAIDMKDDCLPWVAKYDRTALKVEEANAANDEVPMKDEIPMNDETVTKWLRDNLSANYRTNAEVSYPIVEFDLKLPIRDIKRVELKKWAKKNLKAFTLEKKLPEDIFSESPREIAKDMEKSTVSYDKSDSKIIETNADKIDYFISHSWAETSAIQEEKKKLLEEFANQFYEKHKRWPTCWLDKYCIDQAEPGNDVSVIPIYISCCNQILVLLTNSYMQRLWCIWELFTLFIFSKKELAVRRMEILPVGVQNENKKKFYDEFLEQLKNFDFNNAHCFSPQEEMKLRKIMHDIGKKKLEEIKDEIRNMLEGKMKDRNIWCACSDTTGKDSTEETLSSTHNPVNEPAIEEGIELGNVREV